MVLINRSSGNILASDLEEVLAMTKDLWSELRGKKIFITGGTGFFGTWLLESFCLANSRFNLGATAHVLTRNHQAFSKKSPHLANNPAIKFITGDVRNFKFLKEEFSHIIHAAATSAQATFDNEEPLEKFSVITEGTKRVLDFSLKCKAKKFLMISSGAVYGKQAATISQMDENYNGFMDSANPDFVWGTSKRAAEMQCVLYAKKYRIDLKIARGFTFVGPHLPLDIHYAIGNFIRNRLENKPIMVLGDGIARRSYLYASDLIVWLWTILFKGKNCHPYNVGSEIAIDISALAKKVAGIEPPNLAVTVMQKPDPTKPVDQYIPSTKRAREELGLRQTVNLEKAILRTLRWNELCQK